MKKSYVVTIPVSEYRDAGFRFETGKEALSFLETASKHFIIPEDMKRKISPTIILDQEEEEEE